MKIGLFADTYLPSTNGVAIHLQLLKKGLEKKGHEVHIFCPSYPGYIDREKNIHRFSTIASTRVFEKALGMELEGRISLPSYKKFSNIVQELDILHTHHMFMAGRYAAHYSKKFRIPLVYTIHINYKEYGKILPFKKINKKIIKSLLQQFTDRCEAVISPGEKMRTLLEEYGIKKQVHVIRNGIDLNQFGKSMPKLVNELKSKFDISENQKVLLYLGRICISKNLEFLLKALKPTLTKTNTKLIIVGGGTFELELKQLISKLKLKKSVICTGYVPYKEVSSYYSLSDIFVTTSKSEVFPLTILEALASSTPVVAIDAVGTGDIINNEIDGLLTKDNTKDYRDAVNRLLNNDSERNRFAKNARISVEKLSVENCAKKHISLYNTYTKN